MFIGEGYLKKSGGDVLEDLKIVQLYWERSESAIEQTQSKYGRYCHHIAYSILASNEDAEECVNDTYLKAWNSMPPHRPQKLQTFLGKITRNLAFDRYDRMTAAKRSQRLEVAFDEISECLPDIISDMGQADENTLSEAINGFLASLSKRDRMIFMRRYWYLCTITEIAKGMGMSESNVKVSLMRTRKLFREYLEKEGIVI